ncbi:MAG: general secretion pathway protein GspK [Candidatus Lindowbacteria bacterium]|nr:general secretion pathway protein GspK [Candidatus Lindowbacteria bacterium]
MNICTLNTDGKVNINTASAPVLSALMPTLTKMKAARIASRAQVFTFKSVGELRDAVGLENREMEVMARLATVKSDVFRIESTGISGNVEVIMVSIVLRSNEGFQVLSRRIN